MTIAIAIQCRDNSTRMEHKSVRPFYKGKSILEIIINRFKNVGMRKIFVLTTDNSPKTIAIANKLNVKIYRGDEDNVLMRFHKFMLLWDLDGVIRICADNPYIALGLMYPIKVWGNSGKFDYVSYKGAMQRHEGLFCEYISAYAIHDMIGRELTDYDREHVTPYIYNNTYYRVLNLDMPPIIDNETRIRLTVDTMKDFKITQEIYRAIGEKYWGYIYKWLENKRDIKQIMFDNIMENRK